MKQIIQDLKSGATILEEVPVPQVKSGYVLIQTTRTLVSLGTERMLVEFGKANLIDKARQQPDRVKQVLDKIKTDGLQPTLEAVFNKLGQPLPLGYCNVGKVVAVGKGVNEFRVGDRVASNGNHAEYVCVPKNLVARIPDNVTDEEATFTVIGSIGLEGIRLLKPEFGETIVVVGLGLIGLVTAQLLKSNGCNVIGVDFDQQKIDLAISKGIVAINAGKGVDPVQFVEEQTNGIGADGVIITASSKSDDVIHQACEMSRKRGRIILVGVIGMNMRRDDFYKKELSFQVSCSYGAGRYDEEYENKGHDRGRSGHPLRGDPQRARLLGRAGSHRRRTRRAGGARIDGAAGARRRAAGHPHAAHERRRRHRRDQEALSERQSARFDHL